VITHSYKIQLARYSSPITPFIEGSQLVDYPGTAPVFLLQLVRTNPMNRIRSVSRNLPSLLAGLATLVLCCVSAVAAHGQVSLVKISSDPFTVGPGQHATEVEPHVLANGTTLVAAFQTGRIVPGGATAIGWATSTNGGTTWTSGFLPGLTTGYGGGPYAAASDANVAYDAKHGVWLISTLPILNSTTTTPGVAVSRSTDGVTWGNAALIGPMVTASDKNWVACDSTSTSPYYGNCYAEWDNPDNGDQIQMSTSIDGGVTWSAATTIGGGAEGLGGTPLALPNGTVVVPIETSGMSAYTSTNGGASWSSLVTISNVQWHTDAGGIRSRPLPSAAIDGAGTVWVVWEDCRFRSRCSTNDLVYSTSTDGVHWSSVTRIPIDATTSTVDHFIPGIGIDPTTSGTTAHVAVHYYYYPKSSCTQSTCQLYVGYISSANGGSTWNTPVSLAGPMTLTWLANSQNGLMVADYIATAFTGGVPYGVFAVAAAKSGSTYNEAIYSDQGLTAPVKAGRQLSSAGDKPQHHLSDKLGRELPERGIIPPSRRAARSSSK
jgi:hypothetical protein